MTDKLNNLVVADLPEVGGYYCAGNNNRSGFWDEGLTEGRLYMIQRVYDTADMGGDGDKFDSVVINDEGKETWVAMSSCGNGRTIDSYPGTTAGTFYKNPANV